MISSSIDVKTLSCYALSMRKLISPLLIIITIFLIRADYTYATNAQLTLSPSEQTVNATEIFSLKIMLNTDGAAVNRVLAKITYPSNLMSVQSLDTTNSFVDLWYQNNITTPGVLTLEGGISGGGVNGNNLEMATINFEAKSAGNATLAISEDSEVIQVSDGADILSTYNSSTVIINELPPTPTYTPTPTPTYIAPPTSTPIGQASPTPTGLLSPTPSNLPKSGITTPTLLVAIAGLLTLTIGIILVKKT